MSQIVLIFLELSLALVLLGLFVYLRFLRTRQHNAEEAIASISHYLGTFSEADILNRFRIARSTLRRSLDEKLEAGTLKLTSFDEGTDRSNRRYTPVQDFQAPELSEAKSIEPKSLNAMLQGFHVPISAKRIEHAQISSKAHQQSN